MVQLRTEDAAATAYNLVGFQTRMTYGEQARVFRMIPGLEEAEFLRFGSVHRNTFVNAPELLDETMQLRALPGVFLAGQLSGVEGYVESAAGGLLCALSSLAQRLRELPADLSARDHRARRHPHAPRAQSSRRYQPSNITWAHLPSAVPNRRLKKRERYEAMAERALIDFGAWLAAAR